MRAALLVAVSAAVLPALAAEDDPACARFEDPLAYNACLASHGPKANGVGAAPAGGASRQTDPESEAPRAGARQTGPDHAGPENATPAEAPHEPPGASHVYRRRGRIHMEFRLR